MECDAIWVLGDLSFKRVAVSIEGTFYPPPDSLSGFIISRAETTTFTLWDDGSALPLTPLPFTETRSGDLWPGDGVYSRTLNSLFAAAADTYELQITLPTSPRERAISKKVTVRTNTPPLIISWSSPESLYSGDSAEVIAQLTDEDGFADITHSEWVLLKARPIASTWALRTSTSPQWKAVLSPAAAAATPTGSYPSFLRIADRWMSQRGEWVTSDTHRVWVENSPPSISYVLGPDTIWLGAHDTIRFQYTIGVEDLQTALDLDTLFLTISDTSRVVARFFYFDDGGGLDSLPGDGLYQAGFSADPSSRTGIPFTFSWEPSDKSPQRGSSFTTTLILLRYPSHGSPDPQPFPPVQHHCSGRTFFLSSSHPNPFMID